MPGIEVLRELLGRDAFLKLSYAEAGAGPRAGAGGGATSSGLDYSVFAGADLGPAVSVQVEAARWVVPDQPEKGESEGRVRVAGRGTGDYDGGENTIWVTRGEGEAGRDDGRENPVTAAPPWQRRVRLLGA